jgi:hypothetical protein
MDFPIDCAMSPDTLPGAFTSKKFARQELSRPILAADAPGHIVSLASGSRLDRTLLDHRSDPGNDMSTGADP